MAARCERLAASARTIANTIEATLSQISDLPSQTDAPLSVEAARNILNSERDTENTVERLLERLHAIGQHIDKGVFRSALREYQSSTGLLDDHPKLSAAVCTGLGVATLAAGIYGAILAHGPIHHATEAIVSALFGTGFMGAAASVVAVPVSLFFLGIPVLGSSIVGPLAFGATKVLGGKIVRAISRERRDRFAQERDDAEILDAKLRQACGSILQDVKRVQHLYTRFMDRNQKIRSMACSALSQAADDRAGVEQVRALNASLGLKEFSSGIRLLNMERTLRHIEESDFRSPELQAASNNDKAADRSPLGKIGRAFGLAFSAMSNFASNSQRIGTRTALNSAEDLHHLCDHMPPSALDPLSATGSSVGTTLHIALETGVQPEKAFLDAVKGIVGLVKSTVAGGKPEGPSGASLVRVLLELEEIERGNRVRWLVKLGPSLAFALLKKPALVLKAQKLEEASGKVSPEMFTGDYASSKGRAYNAWKSSKEIARLTLGLVREGGYRWLVELPLNHIKEGRFPMDYLSENSYTRRAAEQTMDLCDRFLTTRQSKHREKLARQLDSCLSELPNAEKLRALDREGLTNYAMRKYIDYRYDPDSTVSEETVTRILEYWGLRENWAWHNDQHRSKMYREELNSIHPGLVTLHKNLHGSSNLWTIITNTIDLAWKIGGKLVDPDASVADDERLTKRQALDQLITTWNQSLPLGTRATDTIIDSASGGEPLVMLTKSGQLELLEGAAGRERLLAIGAAGALTIPENGDHVRIAVAETVLGTPLENFQREALLSAHARLVADPSLRGEVVKDLLGKSFSVGQLEGVEVAHQHSRLGLFDLGVIGR